MSDSKDSPALTSPPFDHVKADVILHSSDGIDFHIFRLFLSLTSFFFKMLFNLPQPSEETNTDMEVKDGLPVIPVSEDSKMPDSLLCCCYPCTLAEDPVLEDLREVIDVLNTAKKYSLDAIQQADECELAAKYTLRKPLILGRFEEIKLITSLECLSLLTYHQKCSSTILALEGDLSWIPNELKQGHGISG
ncbi:hypothetical protein F5J12DRAFT_897346 [Pisolithus orientalis]|uniref:uncharacterized protein n=1 Tax=Pisolithus orientalis TaxID=936130 RepID=UPI002224A36B|nr:uncharacterized protein F5J12DRAFT_897346 [Pisolithus orientalis]KAI5992321.1 hypothetical protein F5J12DRAFT_897346 [Pisolithus orientalis]